MLRLADELHETSTVTAELWRRVAESHSVPQMIELIATAGWYRLLSYVINAAQLDAEPWATASPAASA